MTVKINFKPTETESLILANQAAIATALSFVCHRLNGGLYAGALEKISANVHEYLNRYRDEG